MQIIAIADLAAVVRGRRMDLGLTQGDLATRAGVSRKWVNEFEAGGKAKAELGHVLRVLETLGLSIHTDSTASGAARDTDLDDILNDLRRG